MGFTENKNGLISHARPLLPGTKFPALNGRVQEDEPCVRGQETRVPLLPLPRRSCATLGKLLPLSEPQFPHLQKKTGLDKMTSKPL